RVGQGGRRERQAPRGAVHRRRDRHPADAAMMMQLGAEGVFVGSGIFKSGNPSERAKAIVNATTFHDDPEALANISRGLGEAMVGLNVDDLPEPHRLSERGW